MLYFPDATHPQRPSPRGASPSIYKNKWANRWTSYWFYAPIALIGRNEKRKEVITYDLASRMVDLEVDLSPELSKDSRTSASTSAFFQASHVITTRDALEEFVAANI
jgi:hypothetical protein